MIALLLDVTGISAALLPAEVLSNSERKSNPNITASRSCGKTSVRLVNKDHRALEERPVVCCRNHVLLKISHAASHVAIQYSQQSWFPRSAFMFLIKWPLRGVWYSNSLHRITSWGGTLLSFIKHLQIFLLFLFKYLYILLTTIHVPRGIMSILHRSTLCLGSHVSRREHSLLFCSMSRDYVIRLCWWQYLKEAMINIGTITTWIDYISIPNILRPYK